LVAFRFDGILAYKSKLKFIRSGSAPTARTTGASNAS
jgi:hypothetical protein